MRLRHPITCIDARPTPDAIRAAEERRLYASRVAALTILGLAWIVVLVIATTRR